MSGDNESVAVNGAGILECGSGDKGFGIEGVDESVLCDGLGQDWD